VDRLDRSRQRPSVFSGPFFFNAPPPRAVFCGPALAGGGRLQPLSSGNYFGQIFSHNLSLVDLSYFRCPRSPASTSCVSIVICNTALGCLTERLALLPTAPSCRGISLVPKNFSLLPVTSLWVCYLRFFFLWVSIPLDVFLVDILWLFSVRPPPTIIARIL